MRTYIVTRDVSLDECPWLERALKKGESIKMYEGLKEPWTAEFLLCQLGIFGEPFEVPENALIEENWLRDRPDTGASGIPILYLD